MRPGRTLEARLDASNRSETRSLAEIPRDRWDEFNQARDRELSRSARVYQYVSRDIYGAEDLDGHGTWIYVAPYGWCWQPFVAVGWAPYRLGRWVWLDWYGWTWISYDPWGWAPYHYGRWFWWNNAWLWYPGPVIGVRHWWSPALVGWFGWSSWGGFTAGVGFGWGAVGWVPLAPFEPLYPWWGRRFAGYRSVNYVYQNTTIIHNTNITNIYRNARCLDGITVIRGDDFVRGQAGRPLRLGGEELARASLARGALPFAPARESLALVRTGNPPHAAPTGMPAAASASSAGCPQHGPNGCPSTSSAAPRNSGPMRNEEPRGRRESFAESERPAGRRASSCRARGRAQHGEKRQNGPASAKTAGWRRFDEPRRSETRATESEWRRFGDPGVGIRTQEGTRTRSGEAEGIRTRGEARPEETGRGIGGLADLLGDPARQPAARAETEPGERRPWSTGRGADSSRGPEAAGAGADGAAQRISTVVHRGRGRVIRLRRRCGASRRAGPRAARASGGNRRAGRRPRGESFRWSTGAGRSEDGAASPRRRGRHAAPGAPGRAFAGRGRAAHCTAG